jgi:WD40 repeat protein
VGDEYGFLQIFDVATRAVRVEIRLPRFIICTAWSGDGQTLAVGDLYGWITLLDPVTGTTLGRWRPTVTGRGDANGIAWSRHDSLLASAHQDGSIWVWNPDNRQALQRLQAHHGWARGVAFSPDGRLLLTAGEDNTATVWSTETWTLLASLPCGSLPLWSVAWSPDRRHFALGSGRYQTAGSGGVFLWEVIRE